MPYERTDGPPSQITAWPYRSLPRKGFASFLLATYAMMMLPVGALVGTASLWVVLCFGLVALTALWFFLEQSYRSGTLREVLTMAPDKVTLVRQNPDGTEQNWHAAPHWITLELAPEGPVPNYLTLQGNGRRVEFGAFLTPEERADLHRTLLRDIAQLRGPQP